MGHSKNLVKNIFSLGSVQLVNYIFPLITVPYVSRIIGPEGYGIINYATAFISYFSLLIAYGFDLSATRLISRNSYDIDFVNKVVSEVMTSRIILFVISLFLFCFSIFYIEPLRRDSFVSIVLFAGCLANVFSFQFIFQGFQKLGVFAKLNFFRGFANAVFVFILIKKPQDYIWIPILSVLFLFVINVFLLLFARRTFRIKYRLVSMKSAFSTIIRERVIFFSTVVINLYTTTSIVVLGFFASKEEVAYYTTSYAFLMIVNSIISVPVSTALYPFIGKAFSDSNERGLDAIRKVTPVVFYLTVFVSFFLFFSSPYLVPLVYGARFENSILPLRIISALPLIIGLSNIFGTQLMLNMKLDKLFFKTTLFTGIVGVILNIFMSKYFGYVGTAWNCFIVEAFVTLLMYVSLRRRNILIFVPAYFRVRKIVSLFKNIR